MRYSSCTTSMPPEFSKALDVLLNNMQCTNVSPAPVLSNDVMLEDSFQFVQNDFASRSIPAGEGWRWNQAKSRKKIDVGFATVTFFKLAPRLLQTSNNKSSSSPNLKLWKYTIHPKNNAEKSFYAIWCERGLDKTVIETSPPTNECLSVKDFEFLAPFMDIDVAEQLWPENYLFAHPFIF